AALLQWQAATSTNIVPTWTDAPEELIGSLLRSRPPDATPNLRPIQSRGKGPAVAKRIPVLVIEDNRLVRDGIIAMLVEQPDLKVVGAVDGALRALERVREMKPEVVVLDAALGDHDSHRL